MYHAYVLFFLRHAYIFYLLFMAKYFLYGAFFICYLWPILREYIQAYMNHVQLNFNQNNFIKLNSRHCRTKRMLKVHFMY
jgi:hypothetical protein